MANIKFYIVDVFAPKKYAGNQLAVFFDLEQLGSSDQMLAITREINFAESTFITSREADGSFGVRIFTTEYEVPFAGHPTLGTAYIIAKKLLDTPSNEVLLRLKKGDIPDRIGSPDTVGQSLPAGCAGNRQPRSRPLPSWHGHTVPDTSGRVDAPVAD